MPGPLIVIKGAGDLATGVAHRLIGSGFQVVMLEIAKPTVIRRTVAFAEAVYQGEFTVSGITAKLTNSSRHIGTILQAGNVAVLVDPHWQSVKSLQPLVLVDAILAKKNLGTSLGDAPLVIGLGPGFSAGTDVHAVIETKRGHHLGQVIYSGSAIPDTGIPGTIDGYSLERLLRSPAEGVFHGTREIGDFVKISDFVATVGDIQVSATISGVLRGLLHDGLYVTKGCKIGDIDPRDARNHCFTISDKARSVGGGVLEAIMNFLGKEGSSWIPNLKQPYPKFVPETTP